MNLLYNVRNKIQKKIKKIVDRGQEKQKQQQQKLSIVESDTLGMTIIDDNQNIQNSEQIEPISPEQWVLIMHHGNLKGFPFTRIYFSFLKGIPTYLRYKIWLFFSSQNSKQKFKFMAKNVPKQLIEKYGGSQQQNQYLKINEITIELYSKLVELQPLQQQKIQIEKDVHRTYSVKATYKYTENLLRRILYALSNSGIQYSQGMNYILLNLIIYYLQSIGIVNQQLYSALNIQIQKNIFIIMRQIVIRMDTVFGNNNIFQVIKQLQEKIASSVPQVFYLIHKLGMDSFSMFSQHYFSLLSYNDSTPQLSKLMMDLFFVVGQKAIHAILVKMLEISQDKIIKLNTPEDINKILKKELFMDYSKILQMQRKNATKLSDFGLSFYENR